MPKRKGGNGSADPVEGERFRGEFTRLEREYVLARSILAARTASGMSKGDFAKAVGTSKGKLSRWERAEAIPRLEMLQRIADVTGLSFQIGIEPLEAAKTEPSRTAAGSGRKTTSRKSSGKSTSRKSARKATGRKATARKSSRTRAAGRTATKSTARNTSVPRATPKRSSRKTTTQTQS